MSPEPPVFAAPWQAHAFAMAVRLNAMGLFSWSEWSEALAGAEREAARVGACNRDAPDLVDPDLADTAYGHWIAALEALLVAKGVVSRQDVDAMTAAWHRAAEATPHGQPVVLEADPHHAAR